MLFAFAPMVLGVLGGCGLAQLGWEVGGLGGWLGPGPLRLFEIIPKYDPLKPSTGRYNMSKGRLPSCLTWDRPLDPPHHLPHQGGLQVPSKRP